MITYTVLATESNQIDCIQELGKDYVYMTYRLERRNPLFVVDTALTLQWHAIRIT